jgi:hypothetical protein
MFWLTSLAFAGELFVTTATPVVVKVDGTPLDFVPGTMVVQVSGISGIHKVEITSMSGQVLQTMNVSVPQSGGANLLFDGRNLLAATAGANGGMAGGTVGGIGLIGVPVHAPAPAPSPAPAGPTAMDAAKFAALVKAVQSGSFSDDKIGAVQTAASSNWFTIDQVGKLVDLVSFSEDKLAVVQTCRPKVVDPENAFALGSHFSFSGDREAALALFR